MTDLIERLRDRYSKHSQELRDEAADEIERLLERLRTIPGDYHYCGVDAGRTGECHAAWLIDEAADTMEKMLAVVEAARHLLAGGDKEAAYHLEKALAALEETDGTE